MGRPAPRHHRPHPPPQVLAQQAGVQLVSAEYVSGPQTFTVGQTTTVRLTYAVTNPLNERLDYSATVTFTLDQDVSATAATPSTGTASISDRQVTWGGFSLAPGESASITLTTDVTPSSAAAARAGTLVSDTRTTTRTASGGIVDARGPAVTSAQVAGVAAGGIVEAPVSAAAPAAGGITTAPPAGGTDGAAPTTAGPAPAAGAAPAAAAPPTTQAAPVAATAAPAAAAAQPVARPAQPQAQALPHAGAAPGELVVWWTALAGLLTVAVLVAVPLATLRYRRRDG